MNKQQTYFKKLNEKTHPEELKVALTLYNSATQTYNPGKRHPKNKYEIHDERNIAENEIIFDFDWNSYKANYQQAKNVIQTLKNRQIPHLICATGGKGIHIHTFFNHLQLKNTESKKLFKEALSYQLNFKHIRQWFWNNILDEANIDEKYRKKQVDPKLLNFNYSAGTTHLIRDIGGRKYNKDPEGEWKTNYKTWIPPEEFNHKKPLINSFENVRYPENIETFTFDENEISQFFKQFSNRQNKNSVEQLSNERIKGLYTELDGVLKVREGLGEGNRSAGASIIAIASRIDNLDKNVAYDLVDDYANNCSQTGSSFTNIEARQWVDWIYNHEKPYWNCTLLKDINCHNHLTCEHCQTRNKPAMDFLNLKTLLKQVKNVLDEEIVGEDDTKLLIFLLMLSKDFPSKTGRPSWNVTNDPMSQNIILSSDSASGKTWTIKRILELFGENGEDYFIISRMSKSAINYYTDINMDGKIIFVEEMQGLDENTSQLRVWMSEGELNFDTVEKVRDGEGNDVNTLVRKHTQGQPVFVTNQAEGVIGEQLNNRSWVLSMDSSTKQTSDILDYQDVLNKGLGKTDKTKKRLVKDALKQLKQYHFIIYYADNKYLNIPLTDVRARRDYQKFLTLIKCSAYLHQQQREVVVDDDGNEFLICDFSDYEIARQYSSSILGATFSGLTNNEIDLIHHLKRDNWDNTFTVQDIMRNLGKSQPHWFGMLKNLEDLGYVSSERVPGKTTVYSLNQHKSVNIISMPSADELRFSLLEAYKLTYNQNPVLYKAYKWLSEKSTPSEITTNECFENSLIGQGVKPSKTNESDDISYKFQKDTKNTEVQASENVSQAKISELFIGQFSPKEILKHMENHHEQIITFAELCKTYTDIEKLESIIIQLKNTGDIYEIKPSQYVVLK